MTQTSDRRPRLNTSEVAEMFGVTRSTLYRWLETGLIPEPMTDQESGWKVWQQSELDAVANLLEQKKNKRRK